jgi:hypothetical protein
MSRSTADIFKEVAEPAKRAPKRRRPSSLSIRVTDGERALLKRKAGKRSIGAYVRSKALGESEEPRRKSSAKPTIDYALLGQLLGKLGKSDQVACLFLLALATDADRVMLGDAERDALKDACADIRDMRIALMQALGLRGERK